MEYHANCDVAVSLDIRRSIHPYMSLIDYVRSAEEAVSDALSLIFRWPQTFWLAVRRPSEVYDVLRKEAAKPADERFDSVMSPLSFFAVALFMPLYRSLTYLKTAPAREILPGGENLISAEESTIGFGILMLALFPIGVAIVGMKWPLTRSGFRVRFAEQCYVMTPSMLAIQLGANRSGWQESLMAVVAVLALMQLTYAEACLIMSRQKDEGSPIMPPDIAVGEGCLHIVLGLGFELVAVILGYFVLYAYAPWPT